MHPLHSTVVLLKVFGYFNSTIKIQSLHSTVVLLKVYEIHKKAGKAGDFTFYCSSIKRWSAIVLLTGPLFLYILL